VREQSEACASIDLLPLLLPLLQKKKITVATWAA
jgi:hypothetical protein